MKRISLAFAIFTLALAGWSAPAQAGNNGSYQPEPGPCPGSTDPNAVEHLVYNEQGACINYHPGDNIAGACPSSAKPSLGGHVWDGSGNCYNQPIPEMTMSAGRCQ